MSAVLSDESKPSMSVLCEPGTPVMPVSPVPGHDPGIALGLEECSRPKSAECDLNILGRGDRISRVDFCEIVWIERGDIKRCGSHSVRCVSGAKVMKHDNNIWESRKRNIGESGPASSSSDCENLHSVPMTQ